jgi:hypothetical protein
MLRQPLGPGRPLTDDEEAYRDNIDQIEKDSFSLHKEAIDFKNDLIKKVQSQLPTQIITQCFKPNFNADQILKNMQEKVDQSQRQELEFLMGIAKVVNDRWRDFYTKLATKYNRLHVVLNALFDMACSESFDKSLLRPVLLSAQASRRGDKSADTAMGQLMNKAYFQKFHTPQTHPQAHADADTEQEEGEVATAASRKRITKEDLKVRPRYH